MDKVNEKLRPLLSHFSDGKMVHFGCDASSSLIRGEGGFISYKQLRLVTPPPMSIIEKMVHFGCSVSSSLIQGRGGFISYFILSKITILNKINEKLRPPLPPHFSDEKNGTFWL